MANEKIDIALWRLLKRYVKDDPWKPETVFVLSCQIKKLFKALGYRKIIRKADGWSFFIEKEVGE